MASEPHDEIWCALRSGEVEIGEKRYRLEVVDCGELYLPTGNLVACDPFAGMTRGGNRYIKVQAGRYPVRVTVADVSQNADGSDLREAYATLALANAPEVARRFLTPLRDGEKPPSLAPGETSGFGVDSGTACFVDDKALVGGMPPEESWYEELFENGDPSCWFARMDNPTHIREGIANIPLPLSSDGANLILFHSGWGDGFYPLVGGYDAGANLVAVHIDFFVLQQA